MLAASCAMLTPMSRSLVWIALAAAVTSQVACAGKSGAVVTPEDAAITVQSGEAVAAAPLGPATLPDAEAAHAGGDAARAVALFSGYLGGEPDETGVRQAYLGLARAQELLHDCAAAIRAYDAYLTRFSDGPADLFARRGACYAELGEWKGSADSYAEAFTRATLPSARVEALARQGYAHFELGQLDQAEPLLLQADQVFVASQEANSERFSNYYFVGMARFYRAAVWHRRFRDVPIRLPEKQMTEDFARKFALLEKAQDAYNETIKAKHMFWAAGYQLGSLFEEFYDAMMHAPVPDWLDDKQRQVYYEELKGQLRPVVNKAIWVFEKNLATARRLGYESEFTAQTEAKLSELQAVLLAGDTTLGKPHPPLAPEARPEIGAGEIASAGGEPSPVDRKLFVPELTPL
jgi:tetratricopeptide (TPR) repeat protein